MFPVSISISDALSHPTVGFFVFCFGPRVRGRLVPLLILSLSGEVPCSAMRARDHRMFQFWWTAVLNNDFAALFCFTSAMAASSWLLCGIREVMPPVLMSCRSSLPAEDEEQKLHLCWFIPEDLNTRGTKPYHEGASPGRCLTRLILPRYSSSLERFSPMKNSLHT